MKPLGRRLIASIFEHQLRRLLKSRQVKVVAVAGSVGKTSTKTAITAVLNQKYPTLAGSGNYNSELGLPLSVFGQTVPALLINPFAWARLLIQSEYRLHHYPYRVLVLELGTDHPGEIARYLRYLKPDIGVITAVTPEHMQNFPDGLDQVAAEELSLVAASQHLVANIDDIPAKYRHKYIDTHPSHHYYGLTPHAKYSLEMHSSDPVRGTSGALTRAGRSGAKRLDTSLFGAHMAGTAVCAYAVGELLGLSIAEIKAGLASLHPVPGRMNPLQGQNGSRLIDDTYNASPEAVLAALAALSAAPISGRRIAILGSMNELGPESPRYHEQVGEAAANLDLLITIGRPANDHLGPAAVRAGLDPTRFRPADSPYAAGEYVKALLGPGDLVLIKGLQDNIFAEEATKILLASPADAKSLVRQSPAWLRLKATQFADAP